MIGDRIIIKPEHIAKAEYILPSVVQVYNKEKIVITIGGVSGTGKTEVACVLQQLLWEKYSIRAKIIHLDDYYKTDWVNRNKIRAQQGIDLVGILEIQWNKLIKIIKRFRSIHRKLYVQRIHRFTNSIEYVVTNNKCIDVLIIEGLYSNYLMTYKQKEVQPNLTTHLLGTTKDTYAFRKERVKENPDTTFRKLVIEREAKQVQELRKYAQINVPFKL